MLFLGCVKYFKNRPSIVKTCIHLVDSKDTILIQKSTFITSNNSHIWRQNTEVYKNKSNPKDIESQHSYSTNSISNRNSASLKNLRYTSNNHTNVRNSNKSDQLYLSSQLALHTPEQSHTTTHILRHSYSTNSISNSNSASVNNSRYVSNICTSRKSDQLYLSSQLAPHTPRQSHTTTHLLPKRYPYLVSAPHRKYSSVSPDDLNYKIVYTGSINRYVRVVKTFSISTSLVGLAFQPILFQQFENSLGVGLALMAIVNFFVFLTPLLLHHITKRYVTEMLYNAETKTFIATTISLFLRKKHHKFVAAEVEEPRTHEMLTSVVLRGKTPLFFDPASFTDKAAYVELMKYDAALDWELPDDVGRKKE